MGILNGAKVLVFNTQNEVLVLKRSDADDYRPGKLDLPGGVIEAGEDPFITAQRELAEESGITVSRSDLQLLYVGTVFEDSLEKSVNRILFTCRVENPSVTLSHEHSDHLWVPFAELDDVYQHHFHSRAIAYARDHNLLPV